MRVPPEAADDARLIAAGEYDVPLREPPRTVLDGGAHVGLFTRWAAQRWPGAYILAVEPDADNAAALRVNCGALADIRQAALTATAAPRRLTPGRNSLCHHLGDTGEPVRTLPAPDLRGFELVKLDIEGSEGEVLDALPLDETKAVVLEAHDAALADRCADRLLRCGFTRLTDRPTVNGCRLLKFARPGALRTPPAVNLFIAVPVFSGVPVPFMQSLMRLQAGPPCDLAIRIYPGDSLVCRARNALTHDFLASDCTHVLWIDSDLIFAPEHVARLISHPHPIVAGLYPKKQDELCWVLNGLPDAQPDGDGVAKVLYAGTGFLRVAREVFTAIAAKGLAPEYPCDHNPGRVERDFWRVGVWTYPDGSKRYLSEDWWFCQAAKEAGFDTHVDGRVVARHIGTQTWPTTGQLQALTGLAGGTPAPLPTPGPGV